MTKRPGQISTVFHAWLRGNIDYAMAMAFWSSQVTFEEVTEEADRNLKIEYIQINETTKD